MPSAAASACGRRTTQPEGNSVLFTAEDLLDIVFFENSATGEQNHPLCKRLRNQHPVERIPTMSGQPPRFKGRDNLILAGCAFTFFHANNLAKSVN